MPDFGVGLVEIHPVDIATFQAANFTLRQIIAVAQTGRSRRRAP